MKGKPTKIKAFCEETGRRVLDGSPGGSRCGWVGDCEREVYRWLKKERTYLQLWDTLIRVGENPQLLGLFMADMADKQGMCLHGPLFLRLCSE